MSETPRGLSQPEALDRLQRFGRNELPAAPKRTVLRLAMEALSDPLIALLVFAALAHILLGEFRDSIALVIAVVLVIGISVRQEFKAESALEALRELSAPRSTVLRDGAATRIASAELVPDDILILEAGDRIAADALVLTAVDLALDESALTGESVPVPKTVASDPHSARHEHRVYAGTIAVRGRATALVTGTGVHSEIGKLGKSLHTVRRIANPVETELQARVRQMAFFGIFVCIAVAWLSYLRHGNWLQGALAGLALAIALVPEEFPVVARIFLAIGAWRLSRDRVLTRNLGALDSLAHLTVLCVDKTGTLTVNRLGVEKLMPFSTDERELLRHALLASNEHALDPIDRAITDRALQAGVRDAATPVHALSLPMAMVHIFPATTGYSVYAKGAPEVIATMCRMDDAAREHWLTEAQRAAEAGYKVLGVAAGPSRTLPQESPQHLQPLGLVCLSDPLRPGVEDSVRLAYAAGVRIIVITGDHPATGMAIASQAGISGPTPITGAELDAMNDLQLKAALQTAALFCRATPAHKLRIVTLLKELGESVAMTGDGVNDAPALKASDAGIAMGLRGTDVARETADLVLLDDDFPALVTAIRVARGIRKKMRRAVTYIVAVHVPIAGLAVLPFVTGWPLILLPLHVVLLELVIDPACAVVFESEPEGEDVMQQSPAFFRRSLLDWATLRSGLLQGAAMLVAVAAVFGVSYWRVGDEIDSRTLAFSTLLAGNIALIWLNRSRVHTILETIRRPNAALWWITAFVLAMLVAGNRVPFLRDALRLTTLHLPDYVAVFAAMLVVLTLFELPKIVTHWLTSRGRT